MGYAYKISDKNAIYFVTCTVVNWVDVFTRKQYVEIIIESLNYCVHHKGLIVYGYVIMSNHLHLLIQAPEENLSDVLRDFKKFTSQSIIRSIEENTIESRKNWMLWLFKVTPGENSNIKYQFWKPGNHPELCYQLDFMWQKLNYIHNNPVAAGVVYKPEEYVYSSAADYFNGKQVGKVKVTFLDQQPTTYS